MKRKPNILLILLAVALLFVACAPATGEDKPGALGGVEAPQSNQGDPDGTIETYIIGAYEFEVIETSAYYVARRLIDHQLGIVCYSIRTDSYFCLPLPGFAD